MLGACDPDTIIVMTTRPLDASLVAIWASNAASVRSRAPRIMPSTRKMCLAWPAQHIHRFCSCLTQHVGVPENRKIWARLHHHLGFGHIRVFKATGRLTEACTMARPGHVFGVAHSFSHALLLQGSGSLAVHARQYQGWQRWMNLDRGYF